MDFKDQYNKEMLENSPTEEQCERIREGVTKRLSRKKKPLALRAVVISGASVAACAVITFAALLSLKSVSTDKIGSENFAPMMPADGAPAEVNGGAFPISGIDTDYTNAPSHDYGVTGTDAPSMKPDFTDKAPDCLLSEAQSRTELIFSEDERVCTVLVNGIERRFALSEDKTYPIRSFSDNTPDIYPTVNNIQKELSVYFDENVMYIFEDNSQLFGVYVEQI